MVIETAQSGAWENEATWEPARIPGLGDKVHINHLVFAEGTVVVGTGETDAVVLTQPLVCFQDLYVQGGLVGTGNGGLFFLSADMKWVFYASEGFELPPVAQETLDSIWQAMFGQPRPTGYLLAISGRVPADA